MKKRLFVLFLALIALLLIIVVRIAVIDLRSGETYEKNILTQQSQSSSSSTLPYRRGDIVDRNGSILATSSDVYNVILDFTVMTDKEDYVEPTIAALVSCFGFDEGKLRTAIAENPGSRYYVLGDEAKQLSYDAVSAFEALQADTENGGDKIRGVWFEKEYVREYPYNTLASSLIGFTASGNVGIGGIEDYYNDTLNGTDGRQYGYLNADSDYEVKVTNAVNGNTVVSTIDLNLQSIVERKIQDFNSAMSTEDSDGARHIAVMIMDPDSGEVLAMADYPNYNLNNPGDLSAYYSQEEQDAMDEDAKQDAKDAIWQNFCITYTYEPGSTAKPFTVSAGLDSGTLTEDMTFICDGSEVISGRSVHCVNRSGHGLETLSGSLEDSCNDALMQMSYLIGPANFSKYQQLFNFGLKTNIDLPGEARTDSLIYSEDNLTTLNLATNAFGQNFNVTMIQMISAYSSLVNGGSYYQPHVVKRIADENGNTVENIDPILLKQTVSKETADTVRGYLKNVVSEGTGKTAKVDGYSMCGKTGTAQKFENGARAQGKYLVSFIGSVPADDPQLVIYCVVDEPNTEDQAHSTYAQNIVREILEEALPYLNIYPDEELVGTNANLDILGNETAESVSNVFDAGDTTGQEMQEASELATEEATEEVTGDVTPETTGDTSGGE